MNMTRFIMTSLIATITSTANVRADLLTTFSFEEWESWVGDYTTIDFTGFPDTTPISDQYADQGVTFTGLAFIFETIGFVNDGWGLHGPFGLHFYFDEPQLWISVDHAATALFELYYQGELVGISGFNPVGGIGSFLGVVSNEPFDEVIITTQPIFGPHVGIDDLHWGAPIPAPSAIALFALGACRIRRRR
jgi:hypothetical protein